MIDLSVVLIYYGPSRDPSLMDHPWALVDRLAAFMDRRSVCVKFGFCFVFCQGQPLAQSVPKERVAEQSDQLCHISAQLREVRIDAP